MTLQNLAAQVMMIYAVGQLTCQPINLQPYRLFHRETKSASSRQIGKNGWRPIRDIQRHPDCGDKRQQRYEKRVQIQRRDNRLQCCLATLLHASRSQYLLKDIFQIVDVSVGLKSAVMIPKCGASPHLDMIGSFSYYSQPL